MGADPEASHVVHCLRAAAVALLVACGGHERRIEPVATSEPPAKTAAIEPAPPAPPAPAAPAPVEPTALDPAALARDAARAPLAQAAVDAYPNWNGLFSSLVASWSPDGKRIVFGSLRDGAPEIYLGDPRRPAAPPVAITRGPERAIWAGFTRDGKSLVFLRDHGGDENHSLWRVGLDGQGAVELTAGETMRRGEPRFPRDRPGTILYTGWSSTELGAHLFQLDVAGGAPRQVYQQDRRGGLADVTADGSRVLFSDISADDDMRALEVDVATGAARRLFPPEGQRAGIYDAAYGSDGKRVLVTTDDADGVVLLALDAATGKVVARYRDAIPTGRLRVRVSPRGDRIAVYVDAGDHGEVRLLDGRTLKLRRSVAVPLGDLRLGAWRPDGRAFSILISRAEQPADVFAVDAASGKVTPLRTDARPGLGALPPIRASIERVPAFDGLTLPVNVYRPVGDAPARRPALLFFHGGPTQSYAVRWSPFTRFYTALGYVVLEPNVRGSSGFGRAYMMADNREKRADWLKDLETVNAWAKAQPWCDPDRVVVMGGSYGGYTTLMALTRQPALWRAGIDMFGIADLRQFLAGAPPAMRNALVPEFGDVDHDAALLDEFSPMRDVDKIARPLFVYAGQNDPRVPRGQSDTIVRALRARDIPVEYMVAADEGHSMDRRGTKLGLLTRTARFLEDALK